MKDNYDQLFCVVAFLTTFCGIILSGCGDEDVDVRTSTSDNRGVLGSRIIGSSPTSDQEEEVSLIILIANPEEYKGERIRVAGLIVDSISQAGCLLAWLAVDHIVNASSVICEFSNDKEHGLPEDKRKPVTISGKVDILEGITFLRECRLVQ